MSQLSAFRDRVKELVRLKPSEIIVNESNWHEHPAEQIDFFRGLLAEVGFAGVCMVFVNENGKFELIDGEMRQSVASDGDFEIPCIVLDVTREEAEKLLAFHDKIGEMGLTNDKKLFELIDRMFLRDASLTQNADILLSTLDLDQSKPEPADGTQVQQLELVPHEHYDYVIVLARNIQDWGRMHDLLKLKTVKYGRTKSRVGIGRAIEANYLINLLTKDKSDANDGGAVGPASDILFHAAPDPAPIKSPVKSKRK